MGLEPTTFCMANARDRSHQFARVRRNLLFAAASGRTSERQRTRANAECSHCSHCDPRHVQLAWPGGATPRERTPLASPRWPTCLPGPGSPRICATEFTNLYGGGRCRQRRWWSASSRARSAARTYIGARWGGAGGRVGVVTAAHSPQGQTRVLPGALGARRKPVSDRWGRGDSHVLADTTLTLRRARRRGRGGRGGRSCARRSVSRGRGRSA
jgi:hypothetical protein